VVPKLIGRSSLVTRPVRNQEAPPPEPRLTSLPEREANAEDDASADEMT
jgi:hypothetical protein